MYLGTQDTSVSPCFVPIIIKQLSSREQPLLSHYCCKRRVSPGVRSSDRFSPHSKPYHPWNTSRLGSSPPAYHFSHFFSAWHNWEQNRRSSPHPRPRANPRSPLAANHSST